MHYLASRTMTPRREPRQREKETRKRTEEILIRLAGNADEERKKAQNPNAIRRFHLASL